jgi:hypothetical protein
MDKLDQIFKNAMDSQAEPYNPAAWESLSKRLDKQLPPKSNPFKKWGLPGAALVIGISLATWYSMDSSNSATAPISPKAAAVEPSRKELSPKENPATHTEHQPKIALHQETNPPLATPNELINTDTEELVAVQEIPSLKEAPVEELPSKSLEPIDRQKPKELFTFNPIVLPVCAGISSELKNTNGFEVTLKNDQMTRSIAPNSSVNVELGAGNIEIINPATGVILQSNVIAGPKGDLVIDEMIYENGIPVQGIHVKSDANVRSVTYGKQRSELSNKDFTVHVFEKGSTSVQISLADDRGCTSEIQGMIHVSEEYNLLAVNAFEPTSQDSRKNTFMPYALTKRAASFRMIILDPNDGGIVFESTDATLPWDGIDRRFGRMGDTNKAYVWKVTLSEPKVGEKSEYMGTVVRM